MNRFYIETELNTGNTIELTESVFHHWVRVLRAKEQEQAIFFNGKGGEYLVTLTEINKKNALVSIDQFNKLDRTAPFNVVLGQVMSKGDRMDYAIQKATELGVTTIQLLTSDRCEMRLKYDRDQKKLDHWQSVAIAACEQCGMNRVPEILAPISLNDWVKSELPTSRFVLAPNKDQTNILLNSAPDIALLIGPEGGLSETEIETANQYQFKNWCIGDRVLRTETAPVVALSILNYHFSSK
ncbi:16S rRNA (uracil(1498)-N(3))-methyltransferase [Acinetobacter haemolyticus]|uniref:Ribosomal RNA small subunit methyltransferase E n=1 Tax=Acinetobacter haemolyticus TaxID=29430 RepID=A0AAJ2YS49_ACIHA|nr:16S rRNA (uracil(1498)-N(3))-methyltransferase [Acinetobacter haemolyticus]MCU4386624.1 16S rRNA (uracil(1498)-N(3))-methyltransferase [Acinetobacter haemolyticus]NAR17906.1 16S rRNA (uracil(1498)-N(3))-methyltransferase [Acinetobacter haemolyticus]NAR29845.1 16S rRNA (uracil(1498)-N(3))-methyltransferase [Acinetobacter haemolyticus]NAR35918.1 16S rRNA (uracil(1498)-N(3))-methyltransferase [Acinetobacter haemolyticus]NAR46738.1 16S rRNA (uracil(1498)-N(3))-methyltransferase [Acinetobacter h